MVLNTENASSHSRCTGTLVGNNQVITAAHCIPEDIKNLFIVTSIYEFALMERKTLVEQPLIHPKYKSFDIPKLNQPNYDVAIVKFEGTLPANYAPTSWIPSSMNLGDRYWLYVAGYGVSAEGGFDSGEIRYSQVTVENAGFYAAQSFFPGNQHDGHGICKGDSGGPAFIKINGQFRLIGIVSAITGGCNGVSYFNQTAYYNDWLANPN